MTWTLDAVVSVEDIWKIQTALASPLRVRSPEVMSIEDPDL
jgi:hypothetical protein